MRSGLFIIIISVLFVVSCKKEPAEAHFEHVGSYECAEKNYILEYSTGGQYFYWIGYELPKSVEVKIKESEDLFFIIDINEELFTVDSACNNIFYFDDGYYGSVEFYSEDSIKVMVKKAPGYCTYTGYKVSD